jgi:recombination protein RecA
MANVSISTAATIRLQIEAALAHKIPSALTPAQKAIRPVTPTGVAELDALLSGGLPVGAITEMAGAESSGRSSVVLSFLAGITRGGSVAAWIDVSNMFDPESAAAAGVDLSCVLWTRCGVSGVKAQSAPEYRFALSEKYLAPATAMKGLHGGGCGGHPRNEVKGLADAVGGLLRPETIALRCAGPQRRARPERESFSPAPQPSTLAALALERMQERWRTDATGVYWSGAWKAKWKFRLMRISPMIVRHRMRTKQ